MLYIVRREIIILYNIDVTLLLVSVYWMVELIRFPTYVDGDVRISGVVYNGSARYKFGPLSNCVCLYVQVQYSNFRKCL